MSALYLVVRSQTKSLFAQSCAVTLIVDNSIANLITFPTEGTFLGGANGFPEWNLTERKYFDTV